MKLLPEFSLFLRELLTLGERAVAGLKADPLIDTLVDDAILFKKEPIAPPSRGILDGLIGRSLDLPYQFTTIKTIMVVIAGAPFHSGWFAGPELDLSIIDDLAIAGPVLQLLVGHSNPVTRMPLVLIAIVGLTVPAIDLRELEHAIIINNKVVRPPIIGVQRGLNAGNQMVKNDMLAGKITGIIGGADFRIHLIPFAANLTAQPPIDRAKLVVKFLADLAALLKRLGLGILIIGHGLAEISADISPLVFVRLIAIELVIRTPATFDDRL